jgi:hypothetical protein
MPNRSLMPAPFANIRPMLWDQPAAQRSYRAGSMGAPIVNGVQAPYGPVDFATDAFAKFVVQPLYNIASGKLMQDVAAPRNAMPMSDDPREAIAVAEMNRSNAAQALGSGMEAGGMAALGSFGAKAPAGALRSGAARPDAGLDMAQSARLQRAREMGFDTDTPSYHVTDQDFNQFDLNKLGKNTDLDPDTWAGRLSGIGVWSSDDPKKVASAMGMDNYDGTRTLPIFRKGDYVEFPDYGLDDLSSHIKDLGGAKKFVEEMKSQGYSGVKVKDDEFGVTSYVAFDPSNIRSVNAAFDPAKQWKPQPHGG